MEAAAPWLRQAEAVEVVRVGDADKGEIAEAEQLLAGLGVQGTVRVVEEDGLSDGERLLTEATAMGADWLVMGAYRHSRLVDWIVGGVTRVVLANAKYPCSWCIERPRRCYGY